MAEISVRALSDVEIDAHLDDLMGVARRRAGRVRAWRSGRRPSDLG